MNGHRFLLRAALVAVALLSAGLASAQATRTWVSGVGDDVNPCSRTAPCKTFAGAISKTAAGGEISVLDSGSYGALTITKALTIDGNGHVAGILVYGTSNGITVNAPATSDVVLRNLTLDGSNGANIGIRYVAGKSVTLDDVTARGFARGVSFDGGASVTGRLRIVDSSFDANGTGVFLQPAATSTVTATIARVQMTGNGAGLRAESGSTASVSASTISGNSNSGVNVVAQASGAPARVTVESSAVSGNGVGLKATRANATLVAAGCTVSDNDIGVQSMHDGALLSFGDNQVVDNATDGAFTGTLTTR